MSAASTTSSRKRQHSSTTAAAAAAFDNNDKPDDPPIAASWEYLLDRLRILLNRLQTTSELLQTWPETKGGDDGGGGNSNAHAEASALLIASIRKIALGVRGVERHVNGTGDGGGGGVGGGGVEGGGGGGGSTASPSSSSLLSTEDFRNALERDNPVPLDLLDLLDVCNPIFGLNPACYARGLVLESLRRLSVLERRKRALRALARAIEGGMMETTAMDVGVGVVEDARDVVVAGGDDPAGGGNLRGIGEGETTV